MVSKEEMRYKAAWTRLHVYDMYTASGRGHLPSSLSPVDIMVALYYGGSYRFTAGDPSPMLRDRIVISKGHAAMALYPILADIGYLSENDFSSYAQSDGRLRMHADPSIPGIDSCGGSLGHGLGLCAGFALAARMDGRDQRAFALLGDAECYEGSIWETAIFAAHNQLGNLVAIVDRNELAILGKTEDLLRLGSLEEKFESFGWRVSTANGHSYEELLPILQEATDEPDGPPSVIIANTVKGRGISYMEGRHQWHNKFPDPELLARGRQDLLDAVEANAVEAA